MRHLFLPPLQRFRRDTSGAVAIEFVLIAPLLFALLFGIITLGYFIGVSHSVSQLATGAARASVAGLDRAEREAIATQYLNDAGSRYPLLVSAAVTPKLTYDTAVPHAITVDVTYDLDGSLLDLANGFLGLDLTKINGSAYLAY